MKHYKITDSEPNTLLTFFMLPYILMLMFCGMYSVQYYVKYRGWKTLWFWKQIKETSSREAAERFIVEHKHNITIPAEIKTRRKIYKLVSNERNKYIGNIKTVNYIMYYKPEYGSLPYGGSKGTNKGYISSDISKEDCYLKLYDFINNVSIKS